MKQLWFYICAAIVVGQSAQANELYTAKTQDLVKLLGLPREITFPENFDALSASPKLQPNGWNVSTDGTKSPTVFIRNFEVTGNSGRVGAQEIKINREILGGSSYSIVDIMSTKINQDGSKDLTYIAVNNGRFKSITHCTQGLVRTKGCSTVNMGLCLDWKDSLGVKTYKDMIRIIDACVKTRDDYDASQDILWSIRSPKDSAIYAQKVLANVPKEYQTDPKSFFEKCDNLSDRSTAPTVSDYTLEEIKEDQKIAIANMSKLGDHGNWLTGITAGSAYEPGKWAVNPKRIINGNEAEKKNLTLYIQKQASHYCQYFSDEVDFDYEKFTKPAPVTKAEKNTGKTPAPGTVLTPGNASKPAIRE